jgi:hypothetical protein
LKHVFSRNNPCMTTCATAVWKLNSFEMENRKTLDSDRQGTSKSESNRSCKLKALKHVINPLSTKSKMALNSNIFSQHVLQKYIP